jgi:hypothetical protein
MLKGNGSCRCLKLAAEILFNNILLGVSFNILKKYIIMPVNRYPCAKEKKSNSIFCVMNTSKKRESPDEKMARANFVNCLDNFFST